MDHSSSSDQNRFDVLRPMVVDAATIVQPEVKVHQGRLRSTVAAARPDEDEEMLPQGYKDQLWKTLEYKLLPSLPYADDSNAYAEPSDCSQPSKDLERVSSGCCMSLFKRAKRTSFSPGNINRRSSQQGQEKSALAAGLQNGKKKAEGHISTKQLLERAKAAAVDGEAILAAAKQHASAAALLQPADSSCSDDDTTEPQKTVTRVLRGLTPNAILTGNMRPAQHKHWKLSTATAGASDGQHQGTATSADAQHGSCGTLRQRGPLAGATRDGGTGTSREKSLSCKAGGSAAKAKPHDAQNSSDECPSAAPDGTEKLTEEERRARKRAKKLRQKLAQETDPERKAREQQKRAKRRALKKARLSQTA